MEELLEVHGGGLAGRVMYFQCSAARGAEGERGRGEEGVEGVGRMGPNGRMGEWANVPS